MQALLQKGTAESHGDPDPRGADESRGDPDTPRSDESLTNGGVVDPDHPSLQRSDESLAESSVADPASTFEFDHLPVEEPIREPTAFQFDSLAGDETVSPDEDEDPRESLKRVQTHQPSLMLPRSQDPTLIPLILRV